MRHAIKLPVTIELLNYLQIFLPEVWVCSTTTTCAISRPSTGTRSSQGKKPNMSMYTTSHCLSGPVHPATIAARKDAGVKVLRIVRGFPRRLAALSVFRADVLAQILVNAVIFFVQVVARDPNRVTAW
jgi:hypothetical protein